MNLNLRGIIFDIDGVIWRDHQLLPGAQALFNHLREMKIPYGFATNNSSATPEALCEIGRSIGVEILAEQVVTSALAAVSLLQEQFPPGTDILMIGEMGLQKPLEQAGFCLTTAADRAEAVVVGYDRQMTWAQMAEAAYAIARGIPFIGTNIDASFPTPRGLAPGNGAILAALESTTGIAPITVGKPNPFIFKAAFTKIGTHPKNTLIVGDRLETDIAGGNNAGSPTALVLTGVTRRHDLEQSNVKPTYVFDDLSHLQRELLEG